jgi:hypothetical protein
MYLAVVDDLVEAVPSHLDQRHSILYESQSRSVPIFPHITISLGSWISERRSGTHQSGYCEERLPKSARCSPRLHR